LHGYADPMERADSRAMQTQGLSVDSREADAALGALDRTTWTPAGLARTLAKSLQRPLAVVLSLQLALSVALVVLMAVRSAGNAHPDEISHFQAARYFRTHWLPPAVGAPGTESSYSVYGASRI
jgi:hypothetical protein